MNPLQPAQQQPQQQQQQLPQQQQQQPQQQQQQQRRKFKKKVPPQAASSSAPAPISKLPPNLLRNVTSVKIITKPERSYYLVNVEAFVSCSLDYADFVLFLSRPRPGWKDRQYYAGTCVWNLAVKLQRVGIATDQVVYNTNQLISATLFKLPTVMQSLVDQFGETTDLATNVLVSPLVTSQLIRYLWTVASALLDANHADHVPVAVVAAHRGYEFSYGEDIQRTVASVSVAALLEVSCFPVSLDGRDNNMLLCMLVESHRRKVGAATLTGAQYVAIRDADPWAFSGWSLVAGAPPAIPNALAALTANAGTVRQELRSVAAPLPAGVPAALAPFPPPISAVIAAGEEQVLGRHFVLRSASVSADGSFAPLVRSFDDGKSSFGQTMIAGAIPTEYVIGVVLRIPATVLCDGTGKPFNVATSSRRNQRHECSPLDRPRGELFATALRESLL